MTENRKEISRGARFAVDVAVECYPTVSSGEMESESSSNGPSFGGEIKNISSMGACLITSHPLNIKDVLKVSFPIQSSISTYISPPRTLVEVRWTKPVDKDKVLAGLIFLL